MTTPKELNVKEIRPTEQDIERANNLRWNGRSFFGNNSPFPGKVTTMAKTIKDPIKLVRRTKAIVQVYGVHGWCGLSDGGKKLHPSTPWKTFSNRLRELGFTHQQIEEIRVSA